MLQQVSGEEVSTIKSSNFVNSLSGKVAGLTLLNHQGISVRSTQVVIRGNSSIRYQALFVVDGVPIDSGSSNSADQT
jgi:2-keto-3-deoxy-galactonokinase